MSTFLTLKKSNCKNCYKCIRNCPVKSIRFSGNQAYIQQDECILCGQCFVVCPQNAKEIVDETEKVRVLIQSGDPVFVSLAPSYIANYEGVGIAAMREALQSLGFADVEETAVGATIVKREYERLIREEHRDVLISSCCHTVNLLIQKYYPQLLPYLADVLSPMQAHCKDLKARHPGCKTVFIGPCLSKKDEAEAYPGLVDAVLTFEDLSNWFKAKGITPKTEMEPNEHSRARFFPTSGGILKTLTEKDPNYTYMAVDGMDNCIVTLKDLERGGIHNVFIEMSACAGSCIGGPVMEKYHRSPVREYSAVASFAGKEDFRVEQPDALSLNKQFSAIRHSQAMPTEDEIKEILHSLGKYTKEQELNCGTCGYSTCREKAIAIYQGKADGTMCLPFLKDKAENLSDAIFNNTPNGILVLNDALEVQQVNRTALSLMNLRSSSDILGEGVVRILEPQDFLTVKNTGRGIFNKRIYLAEYNRYIEESIIPDKSTRTLLCIMRDVTSEEEAREEKEAIRRSTVEVADQVVDKQMRIVQEIASLLGETAAETKIALTKLKESMQDD